MTVQVGTRVPDDTAQEFKQLTKRLGTSPSDAIRMFVKAFNARQGFPFDVVAQPEPFATEEEATEFAVGIARKNLNEAW